MKISVYITSYNQKAYLAEAIESVLAQTLPPHQILIVDDRSTDGSQELIAGYVSRWGDRIQAIYHERNLGVTASRIDALQAVTGDFVTYVDGDDRFLPTKLEKEAKILYSHPNAQIAFSNFYYLSEDGIRLCAWAEHKAPPQGNVFACVFSRNFPRRTLFRCELVNYAAWKEIGFHDRHLALYEDYEMRIRLTKKLSTVYCNEPLSEYRRAKTGLSFSQADRHLVSLNYIYQKNLALLNDLPTEKRDRLRYKFGEFQAGIAKDASRQIVENSGRSPSGKITALKYYLNSLKYQLAPIDYNFILSLLVPEIKNLKNLKS
jgi:glycosyltransferase involved in cell wall biosynthesis